MLLDVQYDRGSNKIQFSELTDDKRRLWIGREKTFTFTHGKENNPRNYSDTSYICDSFCVLHLSSTVTLTDHVCVYVFSNEYQTIHLRELRFLFI